MKVDVPCWHLPEMWSFGLNGLPCSGSKDGVVIGPPVCSSPSHITNLHRVVYNEYILK